MSRVYAHKSGGYFIKCARRFKRGTLSCQNTDDFGGKRVIFLLNLFFFFRGGCRGGSGASGGGAGVRMQSGAANHSGARPEVPLIDIAGAAAAARRRRSPPPLAHRCINMLFGKERGD